MSEPPNWLPLALFGVVSIMTIVRIVELWFRAGIKAVAIGGGSGAKALLERVFGFSFAAAALFVIAYALDPAIARVLGLIPILVHPLVALSGAAIAFAGVLLIALAQFSMGSSWRIGVAAAERNTLVTGGIYRVSRNPIYVGMVASLAGVFLLAPNAVTLALLAIAALSISLQVRIEEEHLRAIHGAAFGTYCARTRRWL
jgi:protein-S-isoprenylcysteine O-methyltransferase Ste14